MRVSVYSRTAFHAYFERLFIRSRLDQNVKFGPIKFDSLLFYAKQRYTCYGRRSPELRRKARKSPRGIRPAGSLPRAREEACLARSPCDSARCRRLDRNVDFETTATRPRAGHWPAYCCEQLDRFLLKNR